jgi:hypothetical protein
MIKLITKKDKAFIKTKPADKSFIIFTIYDFFGTTKSIKFSMAVFNISADKSIEKEIIKTLHSAEDMMK